VTVRRAILSDAPDIGRLLGQLGYPVSLDFVQRQLALLLDDENEDLLVSEADDKKVIGFLAMHIIPQIAVEGGFARISYLCVDHNARFKGIGKALEREACRLASEKGCDRIELHCHFPQEGGSWLLCAPRIQGIPEVLPQEASESWRAAVTTKRVCWRVDYRGARATAGRDEKPRRFHCRI
jgi:N-acetylglutamate synthase-like GNAT family acetyltransferase